MAGAAQGARCSLGAILTKCKPNQCRACAYDGKLNDPLEPRSDVPWRELVAPGRLWSCGRSIAPTVSASKPARDDGGGSHHDTPRAEASRSVTATSLAGIARGGGCPAGRAEGFSVPAHIPFRGATQRVLLGTVPVGLRSNLGSQVLSLLPLNALGCVYALGECHADLPA